MNNKIIYTFFYHIVVTAGLFCLVSLSEFLVERYRYELYLRELREAMAFPFEDFFNLKNETLRIWDFLFYLIVLVFPQAITNYRVFFVTETQQEWKKLCLALLVLMTFICFLGDGIEMFFTEISFIPIIIETSALLSVYIFTFIVSKFILFNRSMFNKSS